MVVTFSPTTLFLRQSRVAAEHCPRGNQFHSSITRIFATRLNVPKNLDFPWEVKKYEIEMEMEDKRMEMKIREEMHERDLSIKRMEMKSREEMHEKDLSIKKLSSAVVLIVGLSMSAAIYAGASGYVLSFRNLVSYITSGKLLPLPALKTAAATGGGLVALGGLVAVGGVLFKLLHYMLK